MWPPLARADPEPGVGPAGGAAGGQAHGDARTTPGRAAGRAHKVAHSLRDGQPWARRKGGSCVSWLSRAGAQELVLPGRGHLHGLGGAN